MSRGRGIGRGGARQRDGGPNTCRCPKCGHRATHARGRPCTSMRCPKCGTAMVGT